MQLDFKPDQGNLTINTPLIGVVVDIPDKTVTVVAKVFKDYSGITERIKHLRHESFKNHAGLATGVIICVILVMVGSFMINTQPLKVVLSIIGAGFAIFGITSGIIAWRDIPLLEQIDKDIHSITICNRISAFKIACKQFEKNPTEKDIPILFKHLEELTLLFSEENIKLLNNQYDFSLFTSASKFFLMNEIIGVLDNPELKKEWMLILADDKDFKSDLFWNKFNTENPGIDAYNNFISLNKEMEAFKIRKKMVTIFRDAIKESI